MKSNLIDKTPFVSVRLMTYNHGPYIKKAIESCLMQKTTFFFEIVIGDDFSTDETLEICKVFAQKHPEKIKLLDRPYGGYYWRKRQRKGRLYNFTNILDNCSGKYIALLDGDDYWTDPLKLQKQVNFLENNQDVVICGTNYQTNDLGKIVNQERVKNTLIIDGNKIFYYNYIPTLTGMFRKPNSKIKITQRTPYGDWYLWAILVAKTNLKIAILKDFTAVQNIHGLGAYSSINNAKKITLNGLKIKALFLKMNYYCNYELCNDLFLGYWRILKDYHLYKELTPKYKIQFNYYLYKSIRKPIHPFTVK